jgi:hypothetical protein
LNTNLRCSKTEPLGLVHRWNHVECHLDDLRVNVADGRGNSAQHRVTKNPDLERHDEKDNGVTSPSGARRVNLDPKPPTGAGRRTQRRGQRFDIARLEQPSPIVWPEHLDVAYRLERRHKRASRGS